MVEELERAQLGVKLEDHWCGALMYADGNVLVVDSGDGVADYIEVVQAYAMRLRMKFNSKKSNIMVVGKREGEMSWKISRETMEEIEEFKYLVCGLKGNYEVLSTREDGEEGRRMGWNGDVDIQSECTGGS